MSIGGPVDILVVEDNDSQRASILEALEACGNGVHVVAVDNGAEALNFLLARGAWADRAGEDPPKLIMLDLSLHGSNGFSVLAQIRSLDKEDALALVPVVIFTDSEAAGDIAKSYRDGANSYFLKPVRFPDFHALVKNIGQYWMLNRRITF